MKNTVLFLIVGIVVVAVAAVAIYHVFNNGNSDVDDGGSVDDGTTYWFYLDYSIYETSTIKNGWISGKGGNALEGLFTALKDKEIPYEIPTSGGAAGFITSINEVDPIWDMTAPAAYSWSQFIWAEDSFDVSLSGWEEMDVSIAGVTTSQNIFYLGVAQWDTSSFTCLFDPNTLTGWQTGGPSA
ncbi:MAG: hypothetical protein LBP82_02085 [Candidatus Methanoplasma sp.]|nr:hypothetical protein [Candidatus Methanoplasma sp.]